MANRSRSRCRMADCASSTNLAETLKVPCGASNAGAGDDGSNSSGSLPRMVHVTSEGATSLSASARAALRQPSKSVSLSSVMRCIELYSLYRSSCPDLIRASITLHKNLAKVMDCRVKFSDRGNHRRFSAVYGDMADTS